MSIPDDPRPIITGAHACHDLTCLCGGQVFTCPMCLRHSHNPNDAEHGYCGACREFTCPDSPHSRDANRPCGFGTCRPL